MTLADAVAMPTAAGYDALRGADADAVAWGRSGERAARHIRQQILNGDLRPGERVAPEVIASELGMSKSPVREALAALDREGWIRIERNRGAFVNVIDEAMVRDQFELFGLLFGFAARRAMPYTTDEFVDELYRISRRLQRETDLEASAALVYEFHATFVRAARSERLNVVLRSMAALMPGTFFGVGTAKVELKGITAVVKAVAHRDAVGAAEAYRVMMGGIGKVMIEAFRERGLFGP